MSGYTDGGFMDESVDGQMDGWKDGGWLGVWLWESEPVSEWVDE